MAATRDAPLDADCAGVVGDLFEFAGDCANVDEDRTDWPSQRDLFDVQRGVPPICVSVGFPLRGAADVSAL